jgi:hemerythrin-like domain-containing protein
MSAPVAAWHTEHVYFKRLLGLLQKEVDVFHSGERPNYELMLEIIHYLRHYSDQVHHPREDVAFERLAKRCPDLELPIARLRQEHRVIAYNGERLLEYLNEAIDGAVIRRAEVEAAAATFLVYYGGHIAREEDDVLPRAAAALTPEDWQAVQAVVPAGHDPLFGERPEERYRELRRRIALES